MVTFAAILPPVPPPSLPALHTRETPARTRPHRAWQPPAAHWPSPCERNALPGRWPGSAPGQSSEGNNTIIKISSAALLSAPETPFRLLPRGAAPGRGRTRAAPPCPTDSRTRRPRCSRQRSGQGDRRLLARPWHLRPRRRAWAATGAVRASACKDVPWAPSATVVQNTRARKNVALPRLMLRRFDWKALPRWHKKGVTDLPQCARSPGATIIERDPKRGRPAPPAVSVGMPLTGGPMLGSFPGVFGQTGTHITDTARQKRPG